MREVGDDRESVGTERFEVGLVEFIRARERCAVVEGAAHGLLAVGAIHAVPAVEIHADTAYGEHRAAGKPRGRSIAPHHRVELLRLTGIDGAIDLTEQIARRRAGLVGSTRGEESVLSPTGADEGARVLPQHALRVRQRERIIGAHLDEEVAPGPPILESVDLEGRQLLKARWLLVRQAQSIEERRTEAEGHRQA